jgi:hypothetical protein
MKFVVEPVDQDPNECNEDNRLIHTLFNNKVNDTPAVEALWHTYEKQCAYEPLLQEYYYPDYNYNINEKKFELVAFNSICYHNVNNILANYTSKTKRRDNDIINNEIIRYWSNSFYVS